jgi:ribosomal protein S4E
MNKENVKNDPVEIAQEHGANIPKDSKFIHTKDSLLKEISSSDRTSSLHHSEGMKQGMKEGKKEGCGSCGCESGCKCRQNSRDGQCSCPPGQCSCCSK